MGLAEIKKLKEMAGEPKIKKKYTIPKISKKRQNKLKEQKELLQIDEDFYKDIWLASPHRCQNCNCSLPKVPYNWMFHHLLEKRNYPQYRHIPENIMILCLECHSKVEINIDFAPIAKQRRLDAEKNCQKWIEN